MYLDWNGWMNSPWMCAFTTNNKWRTNDGADGIQRPADDIQQPAGDTQRRAGDIQRQSIDIWRHLNLPHRKLPWPQHMSDLTDLERRFRALSGNNTISYACEMYVLRHVLLPQEDNTGSNRNPGLKHESKLMQLREGVCGVINDYDNNNCERRGALKERPLKKRRRKNRINETINCEYIKMKL